MRDDWPNGFDYQCGHCGQMVLASCVVDDQLWDLAFQCYGCKGVSLSPALPPGMALPPGTIQTLSGLLPVKTTIELRRQVLVGKSAVERRQNEAGPRGSTFGGKTKSPPVVADANYFEQLIRDVRELVGPAVFDNLGTVDRKRRQSKVPTKKRHPLMVAVESVRAAIATFGAPTPTVNVSYATELAALLLTFQRWKQHPQYPKMVGALALQNEYLHTVITLGAAAFLEDVGNSVVLNETAVERAPDLLLVVGAQRRAAVEVKVPETLRVPGRPLGYETLLKVIEAAMKKARTGTKGQLSRDRPALLAIGGFHLYGSDVSDFHQAATSYLTAATKGNRHAHLMGIGLVPFATEVRNGQVQPMLGILIAKNPGYSGDIVLVTTGPRPA